MSKIGFISLVVSLVVVSTYIYR